MVERRYVSECISSDYCKGWNDAVDSMPKWISVKDRLPQEKGEICKNAILFMDDGRVIVGWLNENTRSAYILSPRNDFVSKVPMSRCTHWMPLPQPPKGE